jgi:ubiquinone/menaquinone biosynthesis C-methylase UbiE
MRLNVYFNSWPADKPSEYLINFVLEKAKGKNILDIACGNGVYSQRLNEMGFKCVGIDYDIENVKRAHKNGVKACVGDATHLNFEDKSFDTVLMFEILEHLQHPEKAISEAIRVARENVLITVPNCDEEELDKLAKFDLTFFHLRVKDHCQFFTKKTLSSLIERFTTKYTIKKGEPIFSCLTTGYIRKGFSLLYKLNLLKPNYFNRLYAEILVK